MRALKSVLSALLFLGPLLAGQVSSSSPSFDLLRVRTVSLCDQSEQSCLPILSESRTLRINAPEGGATAYLIQVVTPDVNGARRTWQYVVPRHEQRYGKFEAKTSATFFAIPIDLDIPILDIWVTALLPTGDPAHQNPVN